MGAWNSAKTYIQWTLNHINAKKKAGTSRSKSKSTISAKSYSNMKKGFPKKKK